MYITGHLNTVFPVEHQKEILRYLYYHQVHIDWIKVSAKFVTSLLYISSKFLV